MICSNCSQLVPIAKMATRLRKVNDALYATGLTYWETMSAAMVQIQNAVVVQGFAMPEDWQVLNHRLHVEVGEGKWLTVCFYRMDSGRYEVTAYVN